MAFVSFRLLFSLAFILDFLHVCRSPSPSDFLSQSRLAATSVLCAYFLDSLFSVFYSQHLPHSPGPKLTPPSPSSLGKHPLLPILRPSQTKDSRSPTHNPLFFASDSPFFIAWSALAFRFVKFSSESNELNAVYQFIMSTQKAVN